MRNAIQKRIKKMINKVKHYIEENNNFSFYEGELKRYKDAINEMICDNVVGDEESLYSLIKNVYEDMYRKLFIHRNSLALTCFKNICIESGDIFNDGENKILPNGHKAETVKHICKNYCIFINNDGIDTYIRMDEANHYLYIYIVEYVNPMVNEIVSKTMI